MPFLHSIRVVLLIAVAVHGFSGVAAADIITFTGVITQSTSDGTGPAVNNPSLNNIQDLQTYSVTMDFASPITAPGTYTPTSLVFKVPAAAASEVDFGFVSLTITPNAGFDEFSLLGCLTTGAGCAFGNQLNANFAISAALLTSQNVAATGLDQPHPLDLLEDDGTTDIHGSITLYSCDGCVAAPVPEPSSVVLVGSILTGLIAANRKRTHR